MSIVIHRLSKNFGQHCVVNQLSFKAKKGEITGFLGPNGAGKSTTFKIIMGYLKPSQGTVHVCGYNICKHPRQAKKKLGYLAESNPLYLSMYVHEYLHFIGRIYGLTNKQCIAKSKEVVERCGITAMQNKKLGSLSKGYRQRVGLAQVLIHDPEVIILDEPTTGLDPNQLLKIRALIKTVSQEKTVMLSTHIMQEVEALCHQVVMIDQGKMLVHGTVDELIKNNQSTFLVAFKEPVEAIDLESIQGVQKAQAIADRQYLIYANKEKDMREALFCFAKENNFTLLTLVPQENSLEAIFQQLTV